MINKDIDKRNRPPLIINSANSPLSPGEPKRTYGPSIVDPELGTFWGCDQAKTIDNIRNNPAWIDTYEMKLTGQKATFYLGGKVLWTTTKPIYKLVDKMILEEIARIKNKTNPTPLVDKSTDLENESTALDNNILRDCVRMLCMGQEEIMITDELKAKVRACYGKVTGRPIPDNINPFDYI